MATTRADPLLRQAERGAGGAVGEIESDRPWRTYYSPYGEPHRLPADSAQLLILMEQGWTLHKPRTPLKKPTTQQMRDGSIFEFAATGNDVSEGERLRMNSSPAQRDAAAKPTATYYSQNGDVLPGLPADPESMKAYLDLGLSLTPPPAKASGTVTLLQKQA